MSIIFSFSTLYTSFSIISSILSVFSTESSVFSVFSCVFSCRFSCVSSILFSFTTFSSFTPFTSTFDLISASSRLDISALITFSFSICNIPTFSILLVFIVILFVFSGYVITNSPFSSNSVLLSIVAITLLFPSNISIFPFSPKTFTISCFSIFVLLYLPRIL